MAKKEERKNFFLALMLGIAAVAFWRGIWGLADLYFFPSNYNLSLILSAIIGIVILYLIKPVLTIKGK